MFIRRTATRNKATNESYFTHRLVTSQRTGKQVRQITLLNLGRHFDLPQADWPRLCARIDALLAGQAGLLAETEVIETISQRYAARLIANGAATTAHAVSPAEPAAAPPPAFAEVDVDSLQLLRPRSVGVEAVGLAAFGWLGLDHILRDLGFNGMQRAAVGGSLIARMAAPGSELATWRWLRTQSALGELLDIDFEAMPLGRFYRVADLLVQHRAAIEQALFARVQDLFSLPATVTLYDLTNTYFEGNVADNPRAARGHCKQKRTDCNLVTLGLVLDASGFVRRSRLFAGNVAEASTLDEMLAGLNAPERALVIMDAGIATAANLIWLAARQYRYLVVSRERGRQFDPAQAVAVLTASEQTVRLQRVVSEDGEEVRLYCHSAGREAKERAITERFVKRFEAELARLAESLTKPRARKDLASIQQRIGQLKKSSRGVGQHYEITVVPDATGTKAAAITWMQTPLAGTLLTDPGVYCLRSNELTWDAPTLWRTYMTLTDLEAVFRSLKSELGLRPVFHHKADRTDGHRFITVLAYQLVQVIRRKLAAQDQHLSWTSLRAILAVQQRVTATFRQRDGHVLHVRKATVAEPALRKLYDTLGLDAAPGGVKKHTV
ncbi:MAG: IS1634 family transposase [Rhodopila sp.]